MKFVKKTIKLIKGSILFILDSNIVLSLMKLSSRQRKELSLHFKERSWFYKKKLPNSKSYPYIVHSPYEVFGVFRKYEKLFLVGDNWLEKDNKKPIALMVGFNNWKYGFVSDYLKEYRTVYTPRKFVIIELLFRMDPKIDLIIVWGHNESRFIKHYSKFKNIPLYRMEDGFVRSALIGATHSTPYSLILDKTGLYYNHETETDLDKILNDYNFKDDTILMQEAKESLSLMIDMKTSKYNSPSVEKIDKLGIKLKKRVAVLGQVDNDSAIRYGNPDNWSSIELVKLAKYENPHAEVIYRPHPEVYKGYQRSKFRKRSVGYIAKLISPEEGLLEFLETIDHVYTINSLSGLEALLRGKKVTVVGTAFYGGWGLTDDRYKFQRRGRELSLDELFAGVYLKYPRYLANKSNSFMGLKASIYSIHADNYIENFNLHKVHSKDENFDILLNSDYWVHLLMNRNELLSLAEEKLLVSSKSFKKTFEGNGSVLFQTGLLYFVSGVLKNNESRDLFIINIRKFINVKVLNKFLYDVMKYYPGDYVVKHFSWLLKENNEFQDANHFIFSYVDQDYKNVSNKNVSNKNVKTLTLCENNKDIGLMSFCYEEEGEEEQSLLDIDIKSLWEALETSKETMQYEKTLTIIKKLLITDNSSTLVFTRLAEIEKLSMQDKKGVKNIANFLQKMDLYAHNKSAVHIELESFDFNKSKDSLEYITKLYAIQLRLNPDRINRSWTILKHYFISDDYYKLFSSIVKLYSKNDIHKAVAYLELDMLDKSYDTLKNIILLGEKSDKLSVEYSKVLFTLGKHKEADTVIKDAIKKEATHANYTEYLRQLRAKGEFTIALDVAEDGMLKKLKLTNEGHLMPIYFGLGKIKEGFKCFHDSALKFKLIHAFGFNKYRHSNDLEGINNLLLIFDSGPAEEIRFSSIYNELAEKIGFDNFKLTCDFRLKNILSRTFPKISFIPVERTRFFTPEYPLENYNKLPSSDLCNALDNNAIEFVKSSDQIKLISELFFNFRKVYSDFGSNKGNLVADTIKVNYFKEKLPKDTVLIGLSWRSSLTSAARNIHYLTIEDMLPLFDIPKVKFVNLQYVEFSRIRSNE